MERKTMLLALLAAGLVAAGGIAYASAGDGRTSFEDDDDNDRDEAEERLDVALAEGASHTIEATGQAGARGVEGGYEIANEGDAPATVTVTLTGPDGATLGSRTADVPAGEATEIEIEHAFDADGGAAGTYAVTITADAGSVRLTEGEVEFARAG